MRVLLVVVVVLVSVSGNAAANPPLAEQPEPPVVESYRGATLTADGAGLGLLALGALGESEHLVLIGASTWVAGAPLVHVTKGRYGRAAASLAMRVGLPALGLVNRRQHSA